MSHSPKLKSGVSKDFKRAFALDEDGLRLVAGEMENAAATLDHPATVVYHVRRDDDRYYETTDIAHVLADANVPGRRIRRVGIEIRDATPDRTPEPWGSDWIAAIGFTRDRSRHVELVIKSENRTWALLFADSVQPQIERLLTARRVPTWLIVVLLVLVAFLVPFHASRWVEGSAVPKVVVSYLKVTLWAGATIIGLSAAGSRPAWLRQICGPEASFLWGDEVKKHRRREEIRRIVFLGIITAFILAVAANLYSAYLLTCVRDRAHSKETVAAEGGATDDSNFSPEGAPHGGE